VHVFSLQYLLSFEIQKIKLFFSCKPDKWREEMPGSINVLRMNGGFRISSSSIDLVAFRCVFVSISVIARGWKPKKSAKIPLQ